MVYWSKALINLLLVIPSLQYDHTYCFISHHITLFLYMNKLVYTQVTGHRSAFRKALSQLF